eukprot:PhF_6_TR29342/c1_g3_i1/m.43091
MIIKLLFVSCCCFIYQSSEAVQLQANFSELMYLKNQTSSSSSSVTIIPLIRHFGYKPTSMFAKKDGKYFTTDLPVFWGIRARILEQFRKVRNGTTYSSNRITCGSLDLISGGKAINLTRYVYENSKFAFPNRLYFRTRSNDFTDFDLDEYFDLMMNVSLMIYTKESKCRDVVGFNVTWSLEYFLDTFSIVNGYYVGMTIWNELSYEAYLKWNENKARGVEVPLFFPTAMDIFDPVNYNAGSRVLPYGWLCGRGLGNGTWIWECGPDVGKPFNFTNWAPGEPIISDGCLAIGDDVVPPGGWVSKPCAEQMKGITAFDWKSKKDVVYGYIHVRAWDLEIQFTQSKSFTLSKTAHFKNGSVDIGSNGSQTFSKVGNGGLGEIRHSHRMGVPPTVQITTTITSTASFLTPSPAYQCMQSFMQSSCSNVRLYNA